jgi:ribosome maturation factor RimP
MERLSGPGEEARFIVEIGVAARVAALVEPVLESMGYRLVQVRLMGGNDAILEIMAERDDGRMTVEDCEAVSHAISPLLDVHDLVEGSYRLQVSSPGIDRPLVRPADFERWAGHEAKVELKEAISGRKRFRGPLEGYADGEVRIEIDAGELGRQVVGLPVGMIATARLVLTDGLVREALRRAKNGGANDETTNSGAGDAPRAGKRPHKGRTPARRDDTTRVDASKVK